METTPDIDPEETGEWLDSLEAVIDAEGVDRAHFLLEKLITRRDCAALTCLTTPTRRTSTRFPSIASRTTPAIARSSAVSARSSAGTRSRWWCAPTRSPPSWAAISRASSPPRRSTTSASAISGARRPTSHGGDIIYIQGHSSPGIYARAFVEGRLTEEQLLQFPPRSRRPRPLLLSASVADAGLLAVPHRLDGPRADHGDLPGALHEISRGARPRPTWAIARSGPSWATARWTSPNRSARFRWPRAKSSTT